MQAETQSRTAPRWEDPPSPIQNILAEHLASRSRVRQLGRRRLTPGLKGLIWFLRLYVLFMVAVMTINVLQTLH